MDWDKVERTVARKLEEHRDARALRRITRRPAQQLGLSIFSFVLGAVLFFGPLFVRIEKGRTTFALCGLFFICIGQIYLWAYRSGLAVRALQRRLERLEQKMSGEETENGTER